MDVEDCLFLVAFQVLPTLCCNRITTSQQSGQWCYHGYDQPFVLQMWSLEPNGLEKVLSKESGQLFFANIKITFGMHAKKKLGAFRVSATFLIKSFNKVLDMLRVTDTFRCFSFFEIDFFFLKICIQLEKAISHPRWPPCGNQKIYWMSASIGSR